MTTQMRGELHARLDRIDREHQSVLHGTSAGAAEHVRVEYVIIIIIITIIHRSWLFLFRLMSCCCCCCCWWWLRCAAPVCTHWINKLDLSESRSALRKVSVRSFFQKLQFMRVLAFLNTLSCVDIDIVQRECSIKTASFWFSDGFIILSSIVSGFIQNSSKERFQSAVQIKKEKECCCCWKSVIAILYIFPTHQCYSLHVVITW